LKYPFQKLLIGDVSCLLLSLAIGTERSVVEIAIEQYSVQQKPGYGAFAIWSIDRQTNGGLRTSLKNTERID